MAYQQMAYLYDQFMSEAPYDKWIDFTENIIEDSQVSRIADLGCGTGEIAVRLAERGYQMTGVDYSADMLTYADSKANEKNLSITWLHQDLRELEGLANLDLAVSFCDVINYITNKDELEDVFQQIFAILKPGGLFIFDVHSIYQVEHHFKNQTFADVLDHMSYIWFCIEGEEVGEMFHDLTFFAQEGDKYIRFDEFHHQRTYSIEFYHQLLFEAGFNNIKVYADFSLENLVHKDSERIFFVAEKA
ncbi:class I SAM-dependent DNA methyltransferase [Oceanobacillus salinisoli]|uniref:class I SAM-dependent DNA methyltransferase n=1 Tax=Oceanobacillus salinisoli TaxID=2678611 RepID=UPI0012E11A7C|nr:class I SAM-dependent methyltransferase [Oceanobacillus salinisoli]